MVHGRVLVESARTGSRSGTPWCARRSPISAARRGADLYLSIGSAYQALQLAEMGLDEVPDDTGQFAAAARAAWLLDDALRYGRRWRDLAGTTTDRAESLYLIVRIA